MNNKHNIISKQLMISYMTQKIIKPAALVLIISVVVIVGYTTGCKVLDNKFAVEAENITRESYYTQNIALEEQIKELQEEIAGVDSSIRQMNDNITSIKEEAASNVKIQSLVNYIVKSKPSGVSIIMIEDALTNSKYVPIQNPTDDENEQTADEENNEKGDTAEVERGDISDIDMNEPTSNELVYEGENEFILKVRGMAKNKTVLSKYLETIGKYKNLGKFDIVAIEEVEISDYTVNLFEFNIQAKQ